MKISSLVAGSLLIVSVGCSGLPRPITDPNERFELGGAVVAAPSSGPWQLAVEQHDRLLFLRGTTDADHSVFATVAVLSDEFASIQSYRDHLEQTVTLDPGVFRNVATSFEVEQGGVPSVLGRVTMESIPAASGSGKSLRTESVSRQYLHPDTGHQIILSVTQRFPVGGQPMNLDDELGSFFSDTELVVQ